MTTRSIDHHLAPRVVLTIVVLALLAFARTAGAQTAEPQAVDAPPAWLDAVFGFVAIALVLAVFWNVASSKGRSSGFDAGRAMGKEEGRVEGFSAANAAIPTANAREEAIAVRLFNRTKFPYVPAKKFSDIPSTCGDLIDWTVLAREVLRIHDELAAERVEKLKADHASTLRSIENIAKAAAPKAGGAG